MLKFLSIAQIVHPSQLHRLSLSLTVQRVMIKALQNHVFFIYTLILISHELNSCYGTFLKQICYTKKILMVTFGENDH